MDGDITSRETIERNEVAWYTVACGTTNIYVVVKFYFIFNVWEEDGGAIGE